MPRKTTYVNLGVVEPARAAVQRLQLNLSAAAGRRLSLGEVILAAVAVAEAHPDEAVAALTSD